MRHTVMDDWSPASSSSALIRNMVTSLFKHERIKRRRSRDGVRCYAEKMITTAKKETLAAKDRFLVLFASGML